MTQPTPTTEARSRNWGGARPGAGAPRGNRNAATRPAPRTPRDDLEQLARSAPFQDFLRHLPPALRELVVIALDAATEHALRTAAELARGLPEEEIARAQRRALVLAAQLLLTDFADAYRTSRRSREQREAAAVKVLRPWVKVAIGFDLAVEESSQSRSERGTGAATNFNQDPPAAPRALEPGRTSASSATLGPTPQPSRSPR